ncbi:hypothetical protein EVAR_82093_1 [Eumeta japonica]|uniref:Uncharacterized protein n=1 Tax=Eumeta variegata TaxID=151549 RepID=A0A4C1U1U1_EUMVA|nr:hypothetical protein EVAR_82093_1 [Eumeta japonica]
MCSRCTKKRQPERSLQGGIRRAFVAAKSICCIAAKISCTYRCVILDSSAVAGRKRTPILKGQALGGCPRIFLNSEKCHPIWETLHHYGNISFGSPHVSGLPVIARSMDFRLRRVVAYNEGGGDQGVGTDTADAYDVGPRPDVTGRGMLGGNLSSPWLQMHSSGGHL